MNPLVEVSSEQSRRPPAPAVGNTPKSIPSLSSEAAPPGARRRLAGIAAATSCAKSWATHGFATCLSAWSRSVRTDATGKRRRGCGGGGLAAAAAERRRRRGRPATGERGREDMKAEAQKGRVNGERGTLQDRAQDIFGWFVVVSTGSLVRAGRGRARARAGADGGSALPPLPLLPLPIQAKFRLASQLNFIKEMCQFWPARPS